MILKCTCFHPAQDKLHGKSKRVHNPCKRSLGSVKWRCTVCKNEREAFDGIFPPNPVEQAKVND